MPPSGREVNGERKSPENGRKVNRERNHQKMEENTDMRGGERTDATIWKY